MYLKSEIIKMNLTVEKKFVYTVNIMIIFIPFYPQYIKKIELEFYLQKQTKQAKVLYSVIIAGFIVLQIIMTLLIMPKVLSLYTTLNQTPQTYLPYIIIASILAGLALIAIIVSSNPLDTMAVEKLRQDKEDLITINSSFANKTFLCIVGFFI